MSEEEFCLINKYCFTLLLKRELLKGLKTRGLVPAGGLLPLQISLVCQYLFQSESYIDCLLKCILCYVSGCFWHNESNC